MTYNFTKKDIDELKKDPFVQLLTALVGDDSIVNDAIAQIKAEESKKKVEDEPGMNIKDWEKEVKTTVVSALRNFKVAVDCCRESGVNLAVFQDGDTLMAFKWCMCELLRVILPEEKATKIAGLDWAYLDIKRVEAILNE